MHDSEIYYSKTINILIILIFLLQRHSQNVMHTVMMPLLFCFLSSFCYGLCNTQYCLPKIKRHTEFFILLILYYLHYFSPYTSSPSPQNPTHFFPSLFTVMTFFQMCQVYVYSWQKTSRKFIFSSKTLQRLRTKLTLLFGNNISREEKQQAKEKCRILYIK